jgi:hypothetical protein
VSRRGLFALAALLSGCGTNRPEIPPELLQNPGYGGLAPGCAAAGYPSGPYGTDPGSVVANMCFRGWATPDSSPHTEAALENLSLGAFYDPTGKNYELLLINTAAIWCSACKNEHKTLGQHYAELAPRGLALVSALFQDDAGAPATVDDLKLWVETFHVEFPMVLDAPDFQLGIYGSADQSPLNLLVDARSMKILQKVVGDQSSVIWPLIEDELDRRGASE